MGHYSTLRTHTEEAVLTITLHRPERRNALNPEMISELTHALESADRSHVGAIILTGAGTAFCAGLDLDHLQTLHARTVEEHRVDSENIARLLKVLYDLSKPTIAAVNGAAIAGGMGLATVCDFTFAVPEAKFGYTEVKIGFIPAIVSAFLVRQVGDKIARDLLLSGRLFKAEEAHRLGLVNRVVSEQDLLPEAHLLAQCLTRNSPQAMQATKRLLNSYSKDRFDAELRSEPCGQRTGPSTRGPFARAVPYSQQPPGHAGYQAPAEQLFKRPLRRRTQSSHSRQRGRTRHRRLQGRHPRIPGKAQTRLAQQKKHPLRHIHAGNSNPSIGRSHCLRNQLGSAEPLDGWDNFDPSSPGAHFSCSHYSIFVVIPALYNHVWPQCFNQAQGCGFLETNDRIYS